MIAATSTVGSNTHNSVTSTCAAPMLAPLASGAGAPPAVLAVTVLSDVLLLPLLLPVLVLDDAGCGGEAEREPDAAGPSSESVSLLALLSFAGPLGDFPEVEFAGTGTGAGAGFGIGAGVGAGAGLTPGGHSCACKF